MDAFHKGRSGKKSIISKQKKYELKSSSFEGLMRIRPWTRYEFQELFVVGFD